VGAKYFGAAVKRKEDVRLLTGRGRYVDDIALPRTLEVAFLRSPHGHARIQSINTRRAGALPGVRRVLTFQDLASWMRPLPTFAHTPPGLSARVKFQTKHASQYAMAKDKVRFAGEIVAVVVADSRYLAEDAVDLIEVDYEPLPAVVEAEAATRPDAPILHEGWGDNIAVAFRHAVGDTALAFAGAPAVVRERFRVQRYVGMPIEPRGVLASFGAHDGSLTVWSATQVPHAIQQGLAGILELPVHKVRVVAPDVGGGFGTKAYWYPEELLVPLAALLMERPAKWTEDRREHFLSAAQARDHLHDIEVAATRDGTILGIRDRMWLDMGAYNTWATALPWNTVAHLCGPYRVPALSVDVTAIVSNKAPNAPYRGAGRPEVVFVVDRALDILARELGMDPVDLRRRNLIGPAELPYDLKMPYRDGNPLIYDSGDFPATLEAAVKEADYQEFRAEQQQLRARGVYRGIGVSSYIEGTGLGPFEGAFVQLDLSGRVVVSTGACSQGQGLETSLAQIAADALGVPLDWVTVIGGDTQTIPFGIGTFASRSAVLAGNAVATACAEVRRKFLDAAGKFLEVAADDLDIADGQVQVRGAPGSAVPVGRIVQACLPTHAAPGVAQPSFEASFYQHVPTVTYANATHVAQVEVDPKTGVVKLLRYVVAHDCGRVINPMIVDGQIHGGVAQGIGGALLEELVYDESGQLLSGSFMDYLVPTSMEVPQITTLHMQFPSPRNLLGIKGVGEGGAISPPAAISNAIEDALAPFGIRITRTPVSPSSLVMLLAGAERAS
jgi:carbon-monoxide dehydrogenase large subunit